MWPSISSASGCWWRHSAMAPSRSWISRAGIGSNRSPGRTSPQGVGYVKKPNLVIVANAGDGLTQFFRGEDLAPAGSSR
jgi:hypothetical protein